MSRLKVMITEKACIDHNWLMSAQNPKYLHEDQQIIRKLLS